MSERDRFQIVIHSEPEKLGEALNKMSAIDWPGGADAVIRAAVQRNNYLFVRFPEIDGDDMFQEARMACHRAWPKFNPAVAAWTTYLTLVTRRKLIDLCRHSSRRAERESAVAAIASVQGWIDVADEAGLPGGTGGDDETLAVWLGAVYRRAVHAFPRRRGGRGGRNWFKPPQIVAIVLLMRKLALSTRGCRMLFEQSSDLREAVRFRHVPHDTWFCRAKSYAAENLGLPKRLPRHAPKGW